MKKNLLKRIAALCMVALVMVMSLTTSVVSEGNYEVMPCSNLEPKPDPYDGPIHL